MTAKYFVDVNGNYLGGFDGSEPPEGSIQVPGAPDHGLQKWNGSGWDERELTDHEKKLKGVEFEGVMCSATPEDMWGLNSVESWIASGQEVNFKFENGNKLLLNQSNVDAFKAVWIPFRASFF